MSDDNATVRSPRASVSKTSSFGAPAGHSIRRANTIDDAALRRRSITTNHRLSDASSDGGGGGRKRSNSNFSDYNFSEARGILDPSSRRDRDEGEGPETSSLASLSLAFALLPAIAGSIFKDGSAVVTDVMLLGLAGVFLHWSVTQPWKWYHSAQEIRVHHQASNEHVVDDDDSDAEPLASSSHTTNGSLGQVPEEDESGEDVQPPVGRSAADSTRRLSARQQIALRELYVYELTSLASCFALPLVSAYLLHAIRSQLSRPSEGLVSNYNLTIFLLVSELRVFSHMIKLFQSRTLHLQRIVHSNPYIDESGGPAAGPQVQNLLTRLEKLENQASDLQHQQKSTDDEVLKSDQKDTIAKDVRSTIQPDVDALNRAVRRYEKKATLLQLQTESRFAAVDARLEDAIALAAAAAKHSASQRNYTRWLLESAVNIILFPFNAVIQLMLLPLVMLRKLFTGNEQQKGVASQSSRASRSSRNGKASQNGRYSGDRVPVRVAKR